MPTVVAEAAQRGYAAKLLLVVMGRQLASQLAAHEHQRMEANVNAAPNSVVCMNDCVFYINVSAQQRRDSSERVA